MAGWLPGEEDWPERTLLVPATLEHASSEEPFLDIAMELATEYGLLVSLLVRSRPPRAEGRNAAILRGLATRCVKLTQRLIAETYEGRGEFQYILDGLLFESTVDLAYLIRGGAERYDAYLRHALRAEREVWDHLARNQEDRQHIALPQEVRMRRRLERVFSLAEFSPDDIDLDEPDDWPSIGERLAAIGEPRANAMHQLGSFFVRDPWWEIVTYHVLDDDSFEATPGWGRPRVEPLFALVIQGSRVMGAYALRLGADVSDAFRGRFLDLARRAADADRHHELYLARADVPRAEPRGDLPVGDLPLGDGPLGDGPLGNGPLGNGPNGDEPAGGEPAAE